jgi:hypothetical protein
LHLAKHSNISLLVGGKASRIWVDDTWLKFFFEQRGNVSSTFKRCVKERLFLNLFFLFLNLPTCYKSFYTHKWRVFTVFVSQQPSKLGHGMFPIWIFSHTVTANCRYSGN